MMGDAYIQKMATNPIYEDLPDLFFGYQARDVDFPENAHHELNVTRPPPQKHNLDDFDFEPIIKSRVHRIAFFIAMLVIVALPASLLTLYCKAESNNRQVSVQIKQVQEFWEVCELCHPDTFSVTTDSISKYYDRVF